MLRTDRFIFIATCASLLLHAGALEFAKHEAKYPAVFLPPIRRANAVVIALQLPKKVELPPDDMGDRKGTGTATSSSEGAQPLQARKADQDQPALSREPTGPGKIGHVPAAADAAIGERGHGGQRGQLAVNSAPEPLSPSKPTPRQNPPTPSPAALTPPAAPKPTPKLDAPQPPVPTLTAQIPPLPDAKTKTLFIPPEVQAPTPPPTVPPVQVAIATPPPTPAPQKSPPMTASQAATGDGLAPGRAIEADPLQQSDSESDAFTTTGSAVFHDGRISVRSGRKIKTVRPQLLVPGLLDTIGVNDPTLQLKINVDATGKVTLVTVVHSSGSNDIDQPCVVAVYDWWFEPRVDRKGRPIPDVVDFTISFR